MPPTPATHSKAPAAAAKRKKPLSKPRKTGSTKKAAPKGVRFRSRGPHKCTVNAEGKACQGMHKALAEAIGTGFDYDKAKKAGTLLVVPHPTADHFIPVGPTRNKRHLAYSAKQGQKLDHQCTAVVKLMQMPTLRIPLRAFFDKAHMDSVIKLKFGRVYKDSVAVKQVRRIRSVANTLMPETEQLLRYLHQQKLTPVSTQTPVASGKVGTQIDLVVATETGEHIVCELKNGCDKNFQHGKLPAFLHEWAWTQHRHYAFQTLMNGRLYRKTFPDRKVGPPRLIRVDRSGLHMYVPPQWALDAEPALAARMQC